MNKTNKKQPEYSDIVGVDIRDNVVHVLQFRTVRGLRTVHSFGSASLPIGAVSLGVIANADVVGEAIRVACNGALPYAIKSNVPASCSLPESKTFVRIMTLPQMESKAVGEAVKWEMESYIPIPVDDVVYDWRILPDKSTKNSETISVLVIASAKVVVREYAEAMTVAKLSLVAVEIEALAQISALAPIKAVDTGVMMVFVGSHSTRITAVYKGIPFLTASVMVGHTTLVLDVSRALKISVDEATQLVMTDGIGSYISRDPVFDAVAPALASIAAEITRNAQFCYTSLPPCPKIDTMVIFGVGATVKGLRAYLVKGSQMKIVRVHPWQGANLNPKYLPPISHDKSMDMFTLIGLSLNTVTYEDLY